MKKRKRCGRSENGIGMEEGRWDEEVRNEQLRKWKEEGSRRKKEG